VLPGNKFKRDGDSLPARFVVETGFVLTISPRAHLNYLLGVAWLRWRGAYMSVGCVTAVALPGLTERTDFEGPEPDMRNPSFVGSTAERANGAPRRIA